MNTKPEPKRSKGVLVLEDGTEFEGLLCGVPLAHPAGKGYGEVVFNTSLTGYQEILTDPSYAGQMICMTAAHIGNTGLNAEDNESSKMWCSGFIVQELCESPSNWSANTALEEQLELHGIPVLTEVDTRSLTLHLRSRGVLRGILVPANERSLAQKLIQALPPFENRDLISEVTTRAPYSWHASSRRYSVVVLDFGVKWNLLRSLAKLGCDLEVVPASTTADEILARRPDGVFLSNGPGNPKAAPYAIRAVHQLIGKLPIFGVCMGHQILSLAAGADTYKMKFGHRGGNQPVQDQETRHVEISSHNHGYSVDAKSLPADVEVTHINCNDQSVEGIRIQNKSAFSVQYHPEACPGPHDSQALFLRFVELMDQWHTRNTEMSTQ